MSWFTRYLSSSIGRKQLMAVTGLMLCGFLIVHLLGNLTIFLGWSEEGCAFNDYAHALTKNKSLLYIAEVVLLGIFGSHIYLAMVLTLENRKARGTDRYDVNANSGSLLVSSATMPYTGTWMLLFLILHIVNFRLADQTDPVYLAKGLFGVVEATFASPWWSIFYIVSMFMLGAHLKHGFQSALQTLGGNHPKYNSFIQTVSALYGLTIFVGFSSFPVWFIFKGSLT